jgi:hypothetical protein
MAKEDFSLIWNRITTHAGRPFITDKGREFRYSIEGGGIRLSNPDAWISRGALEDAARAMPCAVFSKLPAHCKPRNCVWAILHDTRIAIPEWLELEEPTRRRR